MSILIQFHSRLVRGEDSQANAALIIYVSVTINCISPSTKSKPFLFSIAQKCLCTQTHAQVSNQPTNRHCISKGYRETGKLAVKIIKCLNIQVNFLCCVFMCSCPIDGHTTHTCTRARTHTSNIRLNTSTQTRSPLASVLI